MSNPASRATISLLIMFIRTDSSSEEFVLRTLSVTILGALLAVAFRNTALVSHDRSEYLYAWKLFTWSQQEGTSFSSTSTFDWNHSTEYNYRSEDGELYGHYKSIRRAIDYNYHKVPSKARQFFQDSIIDSMLQDTWVLDHHGRRCSRPKRPWVVFTAGVMGAGKTHTIKLLDQQNRFPLHSFVTVDPDQIRHRLPEFDVYVQQCPSKAGERTRREVGMMAEILTEAALQRGQNVLVDGTLRDAGWYQDYFQELRMSHPEIRIAILHITAPRQMVFERAMSRAKVTGRVVPEGLLERTMTQVPKSIRILQHSVEFAVEIENSGDSRDVEIKTDGLDWDDFKSRWVQSCHVDRPLLLKDFS